MKLKTHNRSSYFATTQCKLWSIRIQAVALLILIMLASPFKGVALAESVPETTSASNVRDTTLSPTEKKDVRLNGPVDRYDFSVQAPPNWSLNSNSFLELKISHSPLLIAQRSSLTLMVNDQPVSSLRLDNTNERDAMWRVNLPAGLQPEDGRYQFSFLTSLRASEANCPPANDPSNWVTIASNSRIYLEADLQPLSSSLAALPQTLFSSKSLLDRQLVVVVPANPSSRDLLRASQLIARLGKMAGYDGMNITLSYGALPPATTNQILLGGPALYPLIAQLASRLELPVAFDGQSFSQNGRPVTRDVGVVQLGTPLTNDTVSGLALVISGGSDGAVDRALQALLDDRSLGLMRGSFALTQSDNQYVPGPTSNKAGAVTPINGSNSFTNLGFDTQTVRGVGSHDLRYSFFLPGNSTISDNGQLLLDYSFSGLVDPKRSSLTVMLNDVPLQAVPLTNKAPNPTTTAQASTTGEVLQSSRFNIELPKDLLRTGDNNLSLRFGLYLDKDMTECEILNFFNDTWGTVYRTSTLNLAVTPATEKTPTFAQFPYPFAGGSNGTLVVLPEAPSAADLKIAAQLTAELSRFDASGQYNRIVMLGANQLNRETLGQKNVVLVGTPATNDLLKEANQKLPVVWNSNTARVLSTDWGMRFAVSDSGLAGMAQITVSPWNQQQAILAIIPSTPQVETGALLTNVIGRKLYIGKYTGNAIAIDASGKFFSFSTLKDPNANPSGNNDDQPNNQTQALVDFKPDNQANSQAKNQPNNTPTATKYSTQANNNLAGMRPINDLNLSNPLVTSGIAASLLTLLLLFFIRRARQANRKKGGK